MMMCDSVVGKEDVQGEKSTKNLWFWCRGADICSKCWTLMRFAMQIIDRVLHGLFHWNVEERFE